MNTASSAPHRQGIWKRCAVRILRWFVAALILVAISCAKQLRLPHNVTWDPATGRFVWWSGEVTVPRGFTYQMDVGADTFEGHFTSPDGKLIIGHDIGGYAGAYANRERAFSFEEKVVEGARVWIARRAWPPRSKEHNIMAAITLPDSGYANFFLVTDRPEDAALIDAIARTFRPKRLDKSEHPHSVPPASK